MHFFGELLHGDGAERTAAAEVILLRIRKLTGKPEESIAAGVDPLDKRLRFGKLLLEVLCDLRLRCASEHLRVIFIDGNAGQDMLIQFDGHSTVLCTENHIGHRIGDLPS